MKRLNFLFPLILVILTSLLTVFVAINDYQSRLEVRNKLTSEKLLYIAANLERSLRSRLSVIPALEAFVKGQSHIDFSDATSKFRFQGMFNRFTNSLDKEVSGVLSMQLAPEAIVTFVSNVEKNQKAIGHDLLVDDKRRHQVLEAINKRDQVTAGPLNLIQGGEAVITRKAVFTSEGVFSEEKYIADGRAKPGDSWIKKIPSDFWGLATVLIDTDQLYKNAGLYDVSNEYQIAIRGRHGLGMKGEVFWGSPEVFDEPTDTRNIVLPGGNWVIGIKNTVPIGLSRSLIIVLFGVLITFLILITYKTYRQRSIAILQNKTKSEFLSKMSHELRTPLNAILGFSQLLELSEDISDEDRDSVEEISRAGTHLLDLINEILDLAKIESGKIELEIKEFNLYKIIMECVALVKNLAKENNIEINLSIPESEWVLADQRRFKQVVLNLLSNAIKYNHANGKVTIQANSSDSNNFLKLSVTDTGKGIPEDQIEKLFNPFDRLEHETSDIEGTGIGLTITARLVELMKGKIGVTSKANKGSTFWIEIPAANTSK